MSRKQEWTVTCMVKPLDGPGLGVAHPIRQTDTVTASDPRGAFEAFELKWMRKKYEVLNVVTIEPISPEM